MGMLFYYFYTTSTSSTNTFLIETIAVKIKKAAEAKVKGGHPWVFENSIDKQNKAGQAGDIVIIFDQKSNKFLAMGLYDPDSPIRIKILSTKNGERLSEEWMASKIDTAYNKRKTLISEATSAYRLCFGENDGLPAIICDVYESVAVLKIYSRIWLPYLESIKKAIAHTTGCKTILLRTSRSVEKHDKKQLHPDGDAIYGTLENEEVVFREHGVKFYANVVKGHKTGFFLDHRANRHKIQQLSKGKTVLDVFSYAGGFSIHALVGGAKKVTAIDISKQALQIAEKNAELNEVKLDTLAGDAFVLLKKLKEDNITFDIVIIDPPAFAKAAKEVPTALNQYQRLAKLGIELTKVNGLLLLASCSSRVSTEDFFSAAEAGMSKSRKRYSLEEKTGHDVDHPIGFPEGTYLKSGYYRIS